MSQETAKTTFITFYSFKGGVGRSMALINTAGILAGQRGFRVLVLDLDLEAPGLSYLDPELPDVSPAEAQRQLPLQAGLVDLLSDAKERGQEADLFTLSAVELEARYTQRIKIPDSLRQFPDGSLRIMPAGQFDHNYAQRLDSLNLSALYRDGTGEPLIRAFKKKFAEAGLYDYVLVDSRTGMSEGAGICTRDLADHVMILSGLNRQNVEGTCEFLREFRAATEGKRKFQIILSPMPNGEDKLLDDRRAVAEKVFQGAWGARVDLSLEIPYHPQLALTEEPHIFRRRRGYLFEAYRAIEASMLQALGHDAQTFYRRIIESLDGKDYDAALGDLRHMIRLDGGGGNLSRLADRLIRPRRLSRRSETEPSQEPVSIERLLKDEGGRTVMEFIVDKLSLGDWDWLIRPLLQELKRGFPALGDRLLKRILEFAQDDADTLGNHALSLESDGYLDAAGVLYQRATETDPKNVKNLCNYAVFLDNRGRDMDAAEAFYKRAVEADPKHAITLNNYAVFLGNRRGDLDAAEAFYKRAIEADPKNAFVLCAYAAFLDNRRRDMDAAEAFYKRAIEADPKNVNNLGYYAVFLMRRRGDMNAAEAYHKQALEADPKNASVLGAYAVFLDKRRGGVDAAEAFYKQALEAAPKHAHTLANYGQFLSGLGRLPEGERTLLSAVEHLNTAELGDAAEVCFSLWLVSRLQEHDAERWERCFKFLIQRGFTRDPWTFDRMLEQAEKKLSSEEFEYAKALALAFLDESKVPELDRYERWRKLEPLDPKTQTPPATS
jgi:Tfp pilus assembly protein PilF/cellulose biosynthesis protein BcsQ